MKLQRFKDGEIHKTNGLYQYVVAGEVEGTYKSVAELVSAHSEPLVKKRKIKVKSKSRTQKVQVRTTEPE